MFKKIFKLFTTDFNYPKGGEVFEATRDVKMTYLTQFMYPYTGSSSFTFKKGEQLKINKPNKKKPKGYYCHPINNIELEDRIVPKGQREHPKYNGFSLSVKRSVLLIFFRS